MAIGVVGGQRARARPHGHRRRWRQPYTLDPATGQPIADLFPGSLRLLTPFLNITGGFALAFGALFSTYVFMPKRRVLPYSLDPNQPGDHFLFNLLIAPSRSPSTSSPRCRARCATSSAAGSTAACRRRCSSPPAGSSPSAGDSLNRFGDHRAVRRRQVRRGACCCSAGFLVSIEAFREIRIPFTGIRLAGLRREAGPEPT